jgi:streptomycin 6-kinase
MLERLYPSNYNQYTMKKIHLSETFIHRIRNTYREDGVKWLEELSFLLDMICTDWDIELLHPFENLSYNFISTVRNAKGLEMVLKVGVPNPELTSEINALKYYSGNGTANIIKSSANHGALLVEALKPGEPLYNIKDDEEATHIASRLIHKIHQSKPFRNDFITTDTWFERAFRQMQAQEIEWTVNITTAYLEQVKEILNNLKKSTSNKVLLHGDLHHWNILSAKREPWLAIDPKGIIGDKVYECGAWLRNPRNSIQQALNRKKLILNRARQFSEELGFDYHRILAWGYVQAFLSAWWSFEEKDDQWQVALDYAKDFPLG